MDDPYPSWDSTRVVEWLDAEAAVEAAQAIVRGGGAMERTPTTLQRAALRAYLATGSHKIAADYLGLEAQTLTTRLARLRRGLDVDTTIEAVAVLAPEEWAALIAALEEEPGEVRKL